jgi:YD repeat-containing protein
VPASLQRIELEVQIAGQDFKQSFPAEPDLSYTYAWDGRDKFGRRVKAAVEATIRVGYLYEAVYYAPADYPAAFARFGTGTPASGGGTQSIVGDRARSEFTLARSYTVRMAPSATPPSGLGGWSLDAHHAYDPVGENVELGDGGSLDATGLGLVNVRLGSPDAPPGSIRTIAATADGVYTAYKTSTGDAVKVERVRPGGSPVTLATIPVASWIFQANVAAGPDGDVYVLLSGNPSGVDYASFLYRISHDGAVRKLTAGDPAATDPRPVPTPDHGDGLPAADVVISGYGQVRTGPNGEPYLALSVYSSNGPTTIMRVGRDGRMAKVAVVDGAARGYDVASDGKIFIVTEHYTYDSHGYVTNNWDTLLRIMPSGAVEGLSRGSYDPYYTTACAPGVALEAINIWTEPIAVDRNGRVLFACDGTLYAAAPGGKLEPIGGGGSGSIANENDATPLGSVYFGAEALTVGPDGSIHFVTGGKLMSSSLPLPAFDLNGYLVPSSDGDEVYAFDAAGRHLRTLDRVTTASRYRFTYTQDGLLAKVEDRDGRATTIERAGDGTPTAIVAPGGERTQLTVNGDGDLTTVAGPGGGCHDDADVRGRWPALRRAGRRRWSAPLHVRHKGLPDARRGRRRREDRRRPR